MTIRITAFEASPDEGQGQARDFRVRWALEEVGQAYDVRLLSFDAMKQPDYLALQPFGSIPIYQEDALTLFETGAIILHIARRYPGLLPNDPALCGRAVSWLFAAINTVEPPIVEREVAMLMENDRNWYQERLSLVEDRVRDRLGYLSKALGASDWLCGDFSAADLMMVTVLRRLEDGDILNEFPRLAAYVTRGEGRPAYKRAFADQLAVFNDSQRAE